MSRPLPVLLVALIIAGCGSHESAPTPSPTPTPSPSPSTISPDDAHARRAAWLQAINGYVANPATIPRMSDAAGRKRFDELMSEPAWLAIDGKIFAGDGEQLIAFFPAVKAFAIALTNLRANDESVVAMLYMDLVSRRFITAGLEFIASLGEPPEKQRNRRDGLARVQLGLAMNTCGLAASYVGASREVSRRALERMTDPASYAEHSTAGLQLVLATLDAPPLTSLQGDLAKELARIRATVAAEHEKHLAASGEPPIRYEPLTMWLGLDARTVVSHGGGFAVTVGPGALVWTEEKPKTVHHLEWRDGGLLFEVYCFADTTAEDVARQMIAVGMTERPNPPGPGHWLSASDASRDGGARILTIGSRTCVAGVEAPPKTTTPSRFDDLLGSLRASP